MPEAALPPTARSDGPTRAARGPVQMAALLAAVSLIALGLAWELWLQPTGRGTLALKVLPLLLPLPGLFQRRLYTYRWTSLLAWWPITEGLVRGYAEPSIGTTLAWAQVGLGLLLFGACVAQVRLSRHAA